MRALKLPLVLALSLAVVSAIGFAGCGNNSTSNGGTGGAGGAAGSKGSGGGSAGGNTGAGGSTGAAGHADAGSDMRAAAGGSPGQDGGNGPMCTALLACCNSATPAQVQAGLKMQCLNAYNMAMAMNDSACGTVLNGIKAQGLCN